jgi:tetratricopeptide (TPR) repeat protein
MTAEAHAAFRRSKQSGGAKDLVASILHRGRVGRYEVLRLLRPHFPEVANNLGLAELDLGKTDEAIAHFREAIRLKPAFAMAHNNLGNALLLRGDKAQAIDQLRRALQCDPNLVEAHSNLACSQNTRPRTGTPGTPGGQSEAYLQRV